MYRKILATVNEHLNSEIAARYAMHFAKRAGARMYICSIAERGISGKDFRTAEDAVKRLSSRAQALGLQTDCLLSTGEPLMQIRKLAAAEKIDLVFAATRHEDLERRFYARTTARSLLLRLPCTVALVRVVNPGRVRPQTILVPVKDRIDHVDEMAAFTAIMAGAFGSRIFLLHTTLPVARLFEQRRLSPVNWQQEEALSDDQVRFIKELARHNISSEKKLVSGMPGRSITIEAAAKRHDMIIMGASERSLLNSLFRGNPVERVLQETTSDLIILKPRMKL